MLANREGLFHAYPVAIGLGETRENKLLQAVIQYRLTEELGDQGFVDCSGENLEITGYHCLEKKDHSLNEATISSLKAALSWDGRDPFWMQDNADVLAQQPVQVRLAFEEFNGKPNLKVQFLNPYGSQRGGVPRADDDLRRNVGVRLGSKFRALAGGTPANPPKPAAKPVAQAAPKPIGPPAASPPSPATASAAPAAQPPATTAKQATATMEEAWAAFTGHCTDEKWTQEAVETEWYRILNSMFPTKQPDQLTAAEWALVREQAPGQIIPF